MNYTRRLESSITEFLPKEKLSEFQSFLQKKDRDLYERLHGGNKQSLHHRKPIVKNLKWSVQTGNIDSLQLLLDTNEFSHEDISIMAAHKGKNDIVDMCINYGARPTNELFIAACTGGHLELARNIEKHLSGRFEDYDHAETYDHIDYNTAVYGAIAKSRLEVLKWLMIKSISPDYTTIGKILPTVKSKEVIALTISATPSVNREDVLMELNKFNVKPSLDNLKASIIYQYTNVTHKIMALDDMKQKIREISQREKNEILSLLVLNDDIKTIELFFTNMTEDEIKCSVDSILIDVQSKLCLQSLMRATSNYNRSKMIRAAVKVGDFEMAETLGYKNDIESTLEGAVFGNHVWLVKEICQQNHLRSQVRKSIAEKLYHISYQLGYDSVERILSIELNK